MTITENTAIIKKKGSWVLIIYNYIMIHFILQMFPELSLIIHSLLLYIYPKSNMQYGNIISRVILIIFLGVIAKKIMKHFNTMLPDYVLYRPKGAFGCNTDCQKNNDNEVGMPSIHSMVAGYYSVKYNSQIFMLFALSRLGEAENPLFYHSISGCHTLPQIIVGYLCGMYIATRT